MNINSILAIVNRRLIEIHNRPLNSTETIILQGIWQNKTYNQIALQSGYSPGYLTTVAAPVLYKQISKILHQHVTKKNCRLLLESYTSMQADPNTTSILIKSNTSPTLFPHYPKGSIPLDSPFYIERVAAEKLVYREIFTPGAFINIHAPRAMGKTSLLLRLLSYSRCQNYYTVSLNLEQVDKKILCNLDQFLRWLCAECSRRLKLTPKLDDYWDKDLGSKVSCTSYIENYLLKIISAPLVLAFDEVNQVFEYPQVARDFLSMLRSWHEEAKVKLILRKIRLIVVHTTESCVPLELNTLLSSSGISVRLDDFSQAEVQLLAQCYKLEWKDGSKVMELMNLVGGHPLLVHTVLYHLSHNDIRLSQLLEMILTPSGIFDNYLQCHWEALQKQPELARAFYDLINAPNPIQLEPSLDYTLSNMGLIKKVENKAIPRCELYRHYFQKHLGGGATQKCHIDLKPVKATGDLGFGKSLPRISHKICGLAARVRPHRKTENPYRKRV